MIVIFGFLLAILVLAISLKYVIGTKKSFGKKPIPQPRGLPFIGQALQMNEITMMYKLDELAKRYGEINSLKLMGKNVVVLNSIPLIRKAFCSEEYAKYFCDKGDSFFTTYCRNDGKSVIFANAGRGYEYKTMKRTYIKALHTYGTGVKDLEEKVLIEMRNIRKKLDNMKSKELDFVSFVKRSLSNIISIVAANHSGDTQGIVQFYLDHQRKEQLEKGEDIFFTDDIIIGQIGDTIEAGIATTWSLLTNSMLIILNHPECQRKIREEIDRVIGREREPSVSDRSQCPYIQAFEKEVHRYATVLTLLLPHVCNESIEFEGYGIEKGSMIISNAWFVHHDEKIWGDPWNFRPERFLDEHGEMLPPEHHLCKSVLAFGLGDRRCIGETFAKTRYFLYIVTLFQNYRFELSDDTKKKGCDPRDLEVYDNKVILRAKPFMVQAVPR